MDKNLLDYSHFPKCLLYPKETYDVITWKDFDEYELECRSEATRWHNCYVTYLDLILNKINPELNDMYFDGKKYARERFVFYKDNIINMREFKDSFKEDV